MGNAACKPIKGGSYVFPHNVSSGFCRGFFRLYFLSEAQGQASGPKSDCGEGSEDIENISDGNRKDSDSGTVSGLSTVFFALDSSSLSDAAKATVDANIEWLKDHPEVVRMELEGHCDSLGSEAYNIGLGRRRAESVKFYLKALNISEEKLEIISYGEERPLSYTDNARNRRVNFVPIY